jgi:hypothetical protein
MTDTCETREGTPGCRCPKCDPQGFALVTRTIALSRTPIPPICEKLQKRAERSFYGDRTEHGRDYLEAAKTIITLVSALGKAEAGFVSIRDDRNGTSKSCRAEYELGQLRTTLSSIMGQDK